MMVYFHPPRFRSVLSTEGVRVVVALLCAATSPKEVTSLYPPHDFFYQEGGIHVLSVCSNAFWFYEYTHFFQIIELILAF